jgi:CrcB protein
MVKILFIAGGGAIGSVLRYAVQGWVQRASGAIFPFGTLAVNVAGCLIIGVLAGALAGPLLLREEYRIGLLIGILGGFTTFSSFGLETFHLANDRQFGLAAANVIVSCALGLAAVWLGYRLAERWFGV